MRKPRLTLILLLSSVMIGGWQFGHGVYIYAKAQLAQYLLHMAWHDSVKTQQNVKPWAWADTWPVARLRVPAHDVELIILAGDSGSTLAFGPGHQSGSVMPGQVGNSIISAHRDTHFQFLKRVAEGDALWIEDRQGNATQFVVTQLHIIDSRAAFIPLDYDEPRLTLVTCYPFNAVLAGGPLRYVVYAKPFMGEIVNNQGGAITSSPQNLPLKV